MLWIDSVFSLILADTARGLNSPYNKINRSKISLFIKKLLHFTKWVNLCLGHTVFVIVSCENICFNVKFYCPDHRVLYIAYARNLWVYPILEKLPLVGRAAFIGVCCLVIGLLSILGHALHGLRWGREEEEPTLLRDKRK